MLPKLIDSAIMLSLVPDTNGDVKFWVELGAAIMYDKPIVAVVTPGRVVPRKLREVADEVVEVDVTTGEGQQRLAELIEVMIAKRAEADAA
jgi:hypothetical protein